MNFTGIQVLWLRTENLCVPCLLRFLCQHPSSLLADFLLMRPGTGIGVSIDQKEPIAFCQGIPVFLTREM